MNTGRALTLAATALSVAAVGRQFVERRLVVRGSTAPLGPATATVAAGRRGPVATRLDGWVPAPPASPPARWLAAAWAAPLTVVGSLLARAGGARCRWDPHAGAYLATGVRGPSGRLLTALGFDGNAIGHVVLCRGADPSRRLLAHESVHVRQAERLGVALPLLYGWFSVRYGYRENPLERAARLGASQAALTKRPA